MLKTVLTRICSCMQHTTAAGKKPLQRRKPRSTAVHLQDVVVALPTKTLPQNKTTEDIVLALYTVAQKPRATMSQKKDAANTRACNLAKL